MTGQPEPEVVVVTPALLRRRPLPSPGGSKNDKGRLLVVGGGRQTPGAVLLAAEAALRVGAGKVQVATTQSTAVALAVALPECLVVGLPEEDGELATSSADRLLELAEGADVVLAGPGIGDVDAARSLLEAVVPSLASSLVVDALGTAFVTAHPDGVRHLAGRALLTPNAGELAEVLGEDAERVEEDVLAATREAATRTGATVLSGARAPSCATRPGTPGASTSGLPGRRSPGRVT